MGKQIYMLNVTCILKCRLRNCNRLSKVTSFSTLLFIYGKATDLKFFGRPQPILKNLFDQKFYNHVIDRLFQSVRFQITLLIILCAVPFFVKVNLKKTFGDERIRQKLSLLSAKIEFVFLCRSFFFSHKNPLVNQNHV